MLKGYGIWEDAFRFTLDPADSFYRPSIAGIDYSSYGMLRYTHLNERTFNPFSYIAEAQIGSGFAKLSVEGRLRIDYHKRGKGLHLRGYAGKYIDLQTGAADYSRYWLTTSYTGANDYLYDGMYLGRSERRGLSSRQVSMQEGGGKIPTPLYAFPLGRSDDWLASLNVKSDLPFTSLPIRLYFDASTYADAGKTSPSGSRLLYSGGLELHALQDVFLLDVPLVMSSDYRDYLESIYPNKVFANSISFSIQLQNINWLRTASTVLKFFVNSQ
jgi:hypothetical protein